MHTDISKSEGNSYTASPRRGLFRLMKAQSRKTKSKKIPDPSPSLTHIFFSLSRFLPATFRQIIKIGGIFVYGIATTGLVSPHDGTVAENKKRIFLIQAPKMAGSSKKLGIPLMAAGRRNTSKRAVLAVEFVLRIHLIGENIV